jgi:hypothetical protein
MTSGCALQLSVANMSHDRVQALSLAVIDIRLRTVAPRKIKHLRGQLDFLNVQLARLLPIVAIQCLFYRLPQFQHSLL